MIIITGKKGQLSVAIRDYLIASGLKDTRCFSVRNDDWKEIEFSEGDILLHVAGIVPKPGVQPNDYYGINRDLTEKLANKAKEEGVMQFIYISSMSVYGIDASLNPQEGTVNELSPCNPTSDYGKSKLEAENILRQLEDDKFKVTIIRVPSIYSDTKREYFAQYEIICNKFRCIPIAFKNCFRSAITVDNLCKLIKLVIVNKVSGIICPDNGPFTASDYCKMIHPEMYESRLIGLCVEKFLRWHPMVKSLFGAVCYNPSRPYPFKS